MSFSSFEPPRLDFATSAVARRMLKDDQFHVAEYTRDGPYPAHREEKDEVDAYVAQIRSAIASGEATDLTADLTLYLKAMFLPDEINDARRMHELDRLTGLAALQWAVDDLQIKITEMSLLPPGTDDPVFAACPSLASRLDSDGLVHLIPEDVSDPQLRSQRVLLADGHAVFPHPYLTHRRELLAQLFDLVVEQELQVRMAVHPVRLCQPEELQVRLLEDYWTGIATTPDNLDSLKDHYNGINTFHHAPQDSTQRIFHPMLGTWFKWDRRSRHDSSDPVRRLYIQEVGLPHNRRGEPYSSVVNPELHAERDTTTRRFTHTDGKVASYAGATYPASLDQPNARLANPIRTRKLWRVDGDIPDRTWMALVGLFFRGNDLIDEHFAALIREFA